MKILQLKFLSFLSVCLATSRRKCPPRSIEIEMVELKPRLEVLKKTVQVRNALMEDQNQEENIPILTESKQHIPSRIVKLPKMNSLEAFLLVKRLPFEKKNFVNVYFSIQLARICPKSYSLPISFFNMKIIRKAAAKYCQILDERSLKHYLNSYSKILMNRMSSAFNARRQFIVFMLERLITDSLTAEYHPSVESLNLKDLRAIYEASQRLIWPIVQLHSALDTLVHESTYFESFDDHSSKDIILFLEYKKINNLKYVFPRAFILNFSLEEWQRNFIRPYLISRIIRLGYQFESAALEEAVSTKALKRTLHEIYNHRPDPFVIKEEFFEAKQDFERELTETREYLSTKCYFPE